MVRQDWNAQRKEEYEESGVRRNLYLVDYEEERDRRSGSARGTAYRRTEGAGRQSARREGNPGGAGRQPVIRGGMPEERTAQPRRRAATSSRYVQEEAGQGYVGQSRPGRLDETLIRNYPGMPGGQSAAGRRPAQERMPENRRPVQGRISGGRRPAQGRTQENRRPAQGRIQENRCSVQGRMPENRRPAQMRIPEGRRPGQLDETLTRNRSEMEGNTSGRSRSSRAYQNMDRRSMSRQARERRRKRVLLQRATIFLWSLCIVALGVTFVLRNNRVAAAGTEGNGVNSAMQKGNETIPQSSGIMVQGLPAEVFAKHPDWEENFLTPNEYSRPGEPLESITNIFVHYTANPGTSAAQNRSYFEQQKDTHENSVSSHFIIGYEGEIIQCVPLDEIAHAVMTRNYDSISIECCYLAEDGSFTPETYDSLISLLAWLVDAYDLESSDILRHYDCGGKKCPLYYTDHEDKWEQLKKDVDKL